MSDDRFERWADEADRATAEEARVKVEEDLPILTPEQYAPYLKRIKAAIAAPANKTKKEDTDRWAKLRLQKRKLATDAKALLQSQGGERSTDV